MTIDDVSLDTRVQIKNLVVRAFYYMIEYWKYF